MISILRGVDLLEISGSAGRNPMRNKIKLNEFLPILHLPHVLSPLPSLTERKKRRRRRRRRGSAFGDEMLYRSSGTIAIEAVTGIIFRLLSSTGCGLESFSNLVKPAPS